jgi:sulfite reductase (ferredoxin)
MQKPSIAAINAALLSTLGACGDVNRNVMACPAPASGHVHRQVQETAQRLAEHLAPQSTAYHEIWVDGEQVDAVTAGGDEAAEPLYGATYLPRKFKIGVAYPGDNCVDCYTQDVGLVAAVDEGVLVGFTVLIGGGMGMTHGKSETYPRLATPFCFVTPGEVLEVVEGIVTIQRDHGDRQNRKHARMKYLVEERGIVWFRTELERRLGRLLHAPRPIPWQDVHDHLGWHRQEDGCWFLGLYVENGRIKDAPQAPFRAGLRAAIATFRPGIRLTGQQNLLLTAIPDAQRAALESLLAAYGIATDPAALGGVRRHAMACPALPTCGLALADAERSLPAIVRQVETGMAELGLQGERLSIRMTGCPNGCARPYMGDIGLVGRTRDVYHLYVGGDWANTRLNTLFAASVPLQAIAATLQPLLEIWKEERLAGESLGDFCHRTGVENLRDRTAAYHGA